LVRQLGAELAVVIDLEPAGCGKNVVDVGRRQGLGRVAQFVRGGVEPKEGEPR
jgi:hypothetical protein